LRLLAITILGVYTGVTFRTLFFERSEEDFYKGQIDFDRIRLDTSQFPLGPDDEMFVVARVQAGNDVLTWIGLYGYGVEPGAGRPGGYKAVGIWLLEAGLQPRPLVRALRAAMRRLNVALDEVSPSQWQANFNSLTLDDLSFTDEALSGLTSGQIRLAPHRRDREPAPAPALIDVSADTPEKQEHALALALIEAQRDPTLVAVDKVFITGRVSLAGRAQRYGMSVFRPGNPSEPATGQATGNKTAPAEPRSMPARQSIAALTAATGRVPRGVSEVDLERDVQDLQDRLEEGIERLEHTIGAIQVDARKRMIEAMEIQRNQTKRFVWKALLAQGLVLVFAVVVITNFHNVAKIGGDLFLNRADKPANADTKTVSAPPLRPGGEGDAVATNDSASDGQPEGTQKADSSPNNGTPAAEDKVTDGVTKGAAAVMASCPSPPAASSAPKGTGGEPSGSPPPAVLSPTENFRAADCKLSVLDGIVSVLTNDEQTRKTPEFLAMLQSISANINKYKDVMKKNIQKISTTK
jgi:hypothetical protein